VLGELSFGEMTAKSKDFRADLVIVGASSAGTVFRSWSLLLLIVDMDENLE
jgi:hypothetical protein